MNFTLSTVALQRLIDNHIVAMLQDIYHYSNITCQVRYMHPLETHHTILGNQIRLVLQIFVKQPWQKL